LDILIDQEFRSLIPPLEPSELKTLEESILEEGVRDAERKNRFAGRSLK